MSREPPTKERLAELMILAAGNPQSVPSTFLQEVFDECDSLAEEYTEMQDSLEGLEGVVEMLIRVFRTLHRDIGQVIEIHEHYVASDNTNGDGK